MKLNLLLKNSAIASVFAASVGLSNAALVAHYDFEEGSGTSAGDKAIADGAQNALQDSGTIGWTAGQVGSFAGNFTNDDLKISGDPLVGATSFTIAAWVDVNDDGGGYKGIFASRTSNWGFNRDGAGSRFDIRFDNLGDGSGSVGWDAADNTALASSGWHHLALTWNGDGTGEYFLDGASLGNVTGATSTYDDDAGAQEWFIGSDSGRNLTGYIDDIGVWKDEVLSDTSIAFLYTEGVAGRSAVTTVPEPSIALLGGLGLFGLLRRRR